MAIQPTATERYGTALRNWRLALVPLAVLACLFVSIAKPPRDDYSPSIGPNANSATKKTSAQSAFVFERRLDDYHAKSQALSLNLTEQLVFVVIALLIILRKSVTVEVPFLGKGVPSEWIHAFAAVVLFYLWLQFGFLLDELIKIRIDAWKLAELAYEAGIGHQIAASLFNDAGVVDGWFVSFRPHQHALDKAYSSLITFMFATFLGLFLAVAHACSIVVLYAGYLRFSSRTGMRIVWTGLLVTIIILYCVTHWLFAYGGRNPNWFQFVLGGFTIALTYVLAGLVGRRSSAIVKEAEGRSPGDAI